MKDELDLLAEDPNKVVQLLLWKERHRNPEMSVQITPHDLKGFNDCVSYLKVVPEARIVRPQGRPAQAAVPAGPATKRNPQGTPGMAARPADPPRPFVVVSLVEKGTENMIRAVENNEEDNRLRIQGEKLQAARTGADQLAAQIEADMRTQTYSDSTIRQALEWLRMLAKA